MPSVVIGDDTNLGLLTPSDRARGLKPRNYARRPYGLYFTRFETAYPVIPRAEWADRIADAERNRTFAYHAWKDALGGIVLDQDGLSFCHGFSAALGAMIQRAAAGLPFVELSGSGIASPTVGFRNAGAWIMDDLRTMREIGCPSVEYVPQLQVSKSGFREGWQADAASRKVLEVYELRPRSLDDQVSALLLGFAICTGINWWSHATVDVRALEGGAKIGGVNSWGYQYGDKGYFERTGTRRLNDEQYAVRVTAA